MFETTTRGLDPGASMMEPELLSPSDGESSHPVFFPSAVGVGTTPWPFGEAGTLWFQWTQELLPGELNG